MAPAKILVRGPNWVGDHVMAGPFYRALRALYPEAHLTLLISSAAAGLPVEGFDDVWACGRRDLSGGVGVLGTAARIRRRRFDLALSLPASFSSGLLLWLSGVPHRVGFSEGLGASLYTSSVPWLGRAFGDHKSRSYLRLLECLGEVAAPEESSVAVQGREDLIVVAPGAANPIREWPHFLSLMGELRRRYGSHRLVVVGAEREKRWHDLLRCWDDPNIEDWVGRTTLKELIGLCGRAQLVVANDSGAAHVAATLAGAPTLVLFGPGDPRYVAPLGPARVVRRTDLPCSPCESARCRGNYGHQSCLKGLELGAVLTEVEAILGAPAQRH